MASMQLKMRVDVNPHLTAMLDEASTLINAPELPSSFAEIVQTFLDVEQIRESLVVFRSAEINDETTGARKLVICADPGHGLHVLLAALRTRDSDRLTVEISHFKALLLVGSAVDSQPHHISQQEAPINPEASNA